MKNILTILCLLTFSTTFSQENYVSVDNINYQILYREILEDLNIERIKYSKKAFSISRELNKAAILHSEQMNKYHFFSHVNKKNKKFATLLDRVLYVDGNFPFLAENIADIVMLNIPNNKRISIKQEGNKILYFDENGSRINYHTYESLANKVVQSWMNSKGHRKNILNGDYSETGLGAIVHTKGEGLKKQYYLLITQTLGGI